MSFGFRFVSDVSDGRLMVMFELIVTERASCMVSPLRRRQSENIIYRFAMSSFFNSDDNTIMKKNASFFLVFSGERIGSNRSGYPIMGVLANSCVIICANFALKSM